MGGWEAARDDLFGAVRLVVGWGELASRGNARPVRGQHEAMDIDLNQPGVPALDTPEGGRWFRTQYARQTLQEAGEAPAVVDAFERLLDAFGEARKLHEGEPDDTNSWSNTLAHLERLISHRDVKDLPRISNAPLCACTHSRAQHVTDPTACLGCQAAGWEAVHTYTPRLAG